MEMQNDTSPKNFKKTEFAKQLAVRVKKLLPPPKIAAIKSIIGNAPVRVLDVGCGNQSCEITKSWLNVSAYHGIDREHWQGHVEDYKKMDQTFFLDLDKDDLHQLPDSSYDVIIFSHVIEHLEHGEAVLKRLVKKLKPGGLIYIETPSPRTLKYPSAIGFLNFYDDPTHKRPYPIQSIEQGLREANCTVHFARTRRDWRRVFLMSGPAIALNLFWYLPFKQKLFASGLWDLLGVAEHALGQKKDP